MKILKRNLNRNTFVVWEMKRNVSVLCVCSAPNCCDILINGKIIKEMPVASGTHGILKPVSKLATADRLVTPVVSHICTFFYEDSYALRSIEYGSTQNTRFSPLLWYTLWRSWLRPCAIRRKFVVSIPDGVIEVFYWFTLREIFP